ncbi:hypothetical protein [Jannaschia sp. LMIT008]|uniref:hypothetical protein n=1 Tax=Jannaschia maritima TaxID=3032585 RepID=UPI002811DFE3|nr:hypothetical protein [Jannaschia sp. LMIT008]
MDPHSTSGKRRYVVLAFVDVDPHYYELGREKRVDLTRPHIEELEEHLSDVSLVSLKTTGLSRDRMIEILESDSLESIERMLDRYKSGAKSRYGRISEVIVTEKGMVREMTGERAS